jgi:hypothetical protein
MATKNKRADRLWDRLIQSYGTRIAETYGADIPKPWQDAVDDLTDEQITYGIRAIISVSPIHPPTLGQFLQTCVNMPIAQTKPIATLQEQLCEYAMLKMHQKFSAAVVENDLKKLWQYSRPWTYVYREWWDATRPKGFEKCAECTGVVIDFDDGTRLGFSVAAMLADTDVHREAMSSFRRGPTPHQQRNAEAVQEQLPDLHA